VKNLVRFKGIPRKVVRSKHVFEIESLFLSTAYISMNPIISAEGTIIMG
jgi:hypothetical protein